ncbi:L-2-keto-3-deoxyarabonate dehydratase [Tritonibacter multivorans]|uniref:L-2-keto-3-deoxyarabonate dehydratase n=1 Tax=Tritonibacter multivorans TaxID=928856 RepID=A0A0P1G4C6_9RHOB|nr:dihydrodipicolinate synthase family protein [Tritonibacter multivorans]MDA7421881.1 dihydrodipicolinate synthase family protein [Tritonibacter multivorans]CUH76670.1 L-2-keto-3-deoxyarabonate dehydratase [Tritonibacter multivorans]SFD49031.1 4-hydroxy-tetrahydrodipicolinate synthase [Tritonibacter multivorans]
MTAMLNGILPVLPTPFTRDGEVDLGAMPGLVRYAIEAGVDGVVFPGFASEVEHLQPQEREDLLAQVVRAAEGHIPIVAGASAETADQVIAHGTVAQALGISWLMIQPPKAIGAGFADVAAFFEPIVNALPEMRIILQNAPAPRGSDLSPATILRIVDQFPQIAYVKEETLPAGPAITSILGDKPDTLLGVIGGGGARYILDEYERGACAAMPALEIAGEHVALDRAWRKGDQKTARDIYVRTLPLLTLQAVYRMRLTKHTMMRRGVLDNAVVRAPTAELDDFATADIDRNLSELGIGETA